ncbi:hypothetical protein GOP47_0014026 [Adiantum capillus-veneris]|uniref:Uncharacterized protein n=1 Tax=Adiantum capillus-veneris TaxID=13818 RepID=A0A9D4UPM5_ADICA|nr:hypothetical protein GOP47_0014026 [Adiantum capillus-veneris]
MRSVDEDAEWSSDTVAGVRTIRDTPFSKVFGLVQYSKGRRGCRASVAIPASFVPIRNSPSARLKAQPDLMHDAIHSTIRLLVRYADPKGEHTICGTGFGVSPSIILTARHVLCKKEISEIQAWDSENMVLTRNLERAETFGVSLQVISERRSGKKDRSGLYVDGADVGAFSVDNGLQSFLLPCSPTLQSGYRSEVAMISFPAVDGFLKQAKKELITHIGDDVTSEIWPQYLPLMVGDIQQQFQRIAYAKNMSVSKVERDPILKEEAVAPVKKRVYDELVATFGFARTGTKVCSVGNVVSTNKVCIGTSCSILRGSSGAAVCLLDVPGHFIAVQSGGSADFDMNVATSVDNVEFVQFYVEKVLPTLPPPTDKSWKTRHIDGFVHWLHLHVSLIPRTSPWYSIAQKDKVI